MCPRQLRSRLLKQAAEKKICRKTHERMRNAWKSRASAACATVEVRRFSGMLQHVEERRFSAARAV
jgi:hypothetical protein